MSKIEVNQISSQCGSTLTIGQSGDTVTLACGASQTGFGRTGTVNWDTTAKTAGFTAVSGNGYFVNTTSGAITVTLPATPSAGDIVALQDYAGTWGTNNVTVARNGSNIGGVAFNATLSTSNQSITLVYVDGTRGWQTVNDSTQNIDGAEYIIATGGTVTTCGDYKIHTFTGPGTFTVCSAGNSAGSDTVDYLVVAGGGGGGGGSSGPSGGGGGGGAGGFRESSGTASGCYTASPLGACVAALPVSVTSYPITVGGGGGVPGSSNARGGCGSNSIFSSITSAGGGGGAIYFSSPGSGTDTGLPGGSGGGAAGGSPTVPSTGGSGNTPPVSPPQGNPGGNSITAVAGSYFHAAGGGGATQAGTGVPASVPGGPGGAGATTSISGSSTAYAGGGGGGGGCGNGGIPGGTGGIGGGGAGACSTPPRVGTAGTTNTGGGGGGSWPGQAGSNGGSGIVIIRYKYQ